ncbi:MAG TPA: dephospho-CoA kinase [Gammaproteobacteria bacterium]|nr:dephospho-CoA kinase [Gammaproteobacteria bacterium]
MSEPSSTPASAPRIFSVGLTGGVASGKSLVARQFVRLGAQLIDTDEIAREVVAPGEPGLAAIREEFGAGVLTAAGELDRRALRKLVFDDADKRRRLETLLHPSIRARTLARLEAATGPYAIVAVPLLVETDFGALVDRVLVVDAPEEAQLERLMRRDGLPRAEAAAMIAAQSKRATRLAAAHDVIDNGGDERATLVQVERLHRLYLELASRNAPRV